MAAHLAQKGIRPDLVLCSSARRARDTLAALTPRLGGDTEIRIEPELYTSDADDLLRRVRAVDPSLTTVLLIGHNPAIEDLATDLAAGGDGPALTQLHAKYPTGTLAILELDIDWRRLDTGTARLRDLVLPRLLPR
jgi:phosphohistidine phosphatase